jgi:lipopolysaccharide export system protein LptA
MISQTLPGGDRVTYITNPHLQCEGDVEIWADSAVAYTGQAMSVLIGSVRYRDQARELRSDQARYFSNLGRLQAQGHVHVTNAEDGSVIDNGDLVYLRETDSRDVEEMTVTTGRDGLRPRAMVRPALPDSVAADSEPPSPYTVVADRIVLRGAGYFNSTGTVEIERDSLFAFADSAEYEEVSDRLILVGSARVESASYDLVGRTITLGTSEGGTNEIRALREAVLTGEDLRITAPLIVLHVTDGSVERLVAVPLAEPGAPEVDSADVARPVATAEDFELTADSLELTAPAEVVERILAVGQARSVSHARDSLNVESLPEIARFDWLEGDTIVVSLRPVPDSARAIADTTDGGGYEVERIVARVGARSLYRLPPEDSTAVAGVDAPALHYVIGDEITIVMNEGEVEAMEVVGQTQGVHLEPIRPTSPDSLPDAPSAPSDTTTVTMNDPGRPERTPADPLPAGTAPARGAKPWNRP